MLTKVPAAQQGVKVALLQRSATQRLESLQRKDYRKNSARLNEHPQKQSFLGKEEEQEGMKH